MPQSAPGGGFNCKDINVSTLLREDLPLLDCVKVPTYSVRLQLDDFFNCPDGIRCFRVWRGEGEKLRYTFLFAGATGNTRREVNHFFCGVRSTAILADNALSWIYYPHCCGCQSRNKFIVCCCVLSASLHHSCPVPSGVERSPGNNAIRMQCKSIVALPQGSIRTKTLANCDLSLGVVMPDTSPSHAVFPVAGVLSSPDIVILGPHWERRGPRRIPRPP